jgi:adenosylcobyric acid synthase
MSARVVMVQGTASSVGKSLLCAGLCRLLRQDGYRVAPFKAQNMALNSFATPEGLEIGRAQAVQAAAAGIPPHVDMNPILLKPEADSRSQVVLNGKPAGSMSARDYFARTLDLWPLVTIALDRLRARYDVVVIEGAGSPAEVNLRAREIVNMRVARYAAAPVLLVGDVDRGGVMAWWARSICCCRRSGRWSKA